MTGQQKFIASLYLVVIVCLSLILFAFYRSYMASGKRPLTALLDQYHELKQKNPDSAKRALDLIVENYPDNKVAQDELSKWYLSQGDVKSAYTQLKKLAQLYPNDVDIQKRFQKLRQDLGADEGKTLSQNEAEKIDDKDSGLLASQNETAKTVNDSQPIRKTTAVNQKVVAPVSLKVKWLNLFYLNKTKNPVIAINALHLLLAHYPSDVQVIKEAAYFYLKQKNNKTALIYFKQAYFLTKDPMLAMQTAYILDGLQEKRAAYHYFHLAVKNTDLTERIKAEMAKTNLRSMQTKFLSDPFFADIFFTPFYQSRFKLVIYPLIAHAGIKLNDTYHLSAYLSYRRTDDNKSLGTGALPQIYEDNAAITSLGLQGTPFPTIPLYAFMEAGKAVDLVYHDRGRFRNDFRTGLSYYNEWNKTARYTFHPSFKLVPNMDLYADGIYFSRYLNTIATVRARPGVEFFRFGSMAFNFYIKAFISEDRNRIFYNNILETGPALAFTPSDRYNFTIRYESLRGYYLPVGNSSANPNPYGSRYHNNYFFIDSYIGI